MKVFKLNDCDWVAATTEEEAKQFYMEQTSQTREEIEEFYEGEVSLTDTMFWWEEDVPPEERPQFKTGEVIGKKVFYIPFSWVIQHGDITKPCIIATTEW